MDQKPVSHLYSCYRKHMSHLDVERTSWINFENLRLPIKHNPILLRRVEQQ